MRNCAILLVLSILLHEAASVPVNVALNKPVTALYTCGIFGQEYFNTLSDIYSSHANRPRRACTDIRSSNGASSTQSTTVKPSFPPEAMVDGDLSTHWQSTSRSRTYHYGQELMLEMTRELEAMINIDLLQEFLAEQITIQLGDALSPQKIAIEKSMNGITYTPWLYGVASLDQCAEFFSTTIKSVPASRTDTICVGYIANDTPPGDLITLDLSQSDVTLKEWQRVRYIRVKLFDMLYAYPYNVLANTFNHYSINELTVLAECPCNGQQDGCEISPTSGMYECICGGNTRGKFCESCLPLFNQFPFRYGESCVECNCFEHANSCFYQASAEEEKLSLDKNGTRTGGGVCADCQHNTAGINCEKCVDLYYRPVDRLQTSEDACVPCQCNSSGSTINPTTGLVDCLMNNDKPLTDGKVPGDCYCKANVIGSKCNQCKAEFYNLQQSNPDGCTPCACNPTGTVGASELCTNDTIGQCSCKPNVEGRACDQCKDGFYGLADDDPNGCSPCDCDVGGSLNQICNKETGQCVCRSDNIFGRQCDSVHSSYYYPGPHGLFVELEDSFGEILWRREEQYSGYSGLGYAVVQSGESLTTLLNIPSIAILSDEFYLILTYRSSDDSSVDIHPFGGGENSTLSLTLPACPDEWCQVDTSTGESVSLYSGPNLLSVTVNSGQPLLDKLTAVPVDFVQTDSVLSYTLPAGCDLLRNMRPTDPADQATCERAIFSLTMYKLGAPLPCNCDSTGSVSLTCEVSGGRCDCQPGVIGRTCDSCSPKHYGFSLTGCTECSCEEYGSTCDAVTGQCNCPENTIGRQCEICVPNTWGWNKTEGCKPCGCSKLGSLSQQCNGTTGVCTCRIGVEGDKCDVCQDRYYDLTSQGCASCLCDKAGASSDVCNKTSGQCECKAYTDGRQCNNCLPGTFGLDSRNPEGCLECICMGITTECVSAGIKLSSSLYQLSKRTENGSIPTLSLATSDGDAYNTSVYLDSNADLTTAVVVDLVETDPRLFWMTPASLVSDLLSLYGSDISFTVNYVIVDGQPLPENRAVLVSSSGPSLTYTLDTVNQGRDTAHVVTLREAGWQFSDTLAPTRGEFLKALATATALLLPASFSSGKHTSRLSKLAFSSVSEVGPVNPAVELCTCGAEYLGRSCERCLPGHKRENVSSSDYLGTCTPCMCNGHSAICDPDTGACEDCLDNTTGDQCEECLPGFYGNATQGTSTDCSPCPCYYPRVVNATCAMDVNSTNIVCSYCQDGYIGDICDDCDPLYYGDPKIENGTCVPCTCNGNSDSCDTATGTCDSCGFNTTGRNCEICMDEFYGNASLQNCQECKCSETTSNSSVCDIVTGQCPCAYGVEGRTCDFCFMGFWGFTSPDFIGCQPCGCLETGSTTIQCNNDTGICDCKPNTVGDKCTTCEDGYYGLPSLPCETCGCDATGSVNVTACNKSNGQCDCKPGIGGRQCNQCLPFYVNFTDTGCDACDECHTTLGDSVAARLIVAEEILNRTLLVIEIQGEDMRLQRLVARLNESLDLLGLAGSSATSVTDIINNVSNLLSTTQENKDKSASEVTRHAALAATATNLTNDFKNQERLLNSYTLFLTQYNSSASQYLNRGDAGDTTLISFDSELERASTLLSETQLTAEMMAANNAITRQASEILVLNSTSALLNHDMDSAATSVTNLTMSLDGQYFTLSSVDSTLTQAQVFHSQVEDLEEAANSILQNTEIKNTESQTMLSAARAAARNTDAVFNGNALTVMTGGDFLPFPDGVTNFLTGTDRLRRLLTSIPTLTEQVEKGVNDSEAHVELLEESFLALKSSYDNISTIALDAEEAIQNFETVVKDLDTAVSTITLANQLIGEVRANVSGEAFERLSQEYTAEKVNAEALRTEIMAVNYQTQVLQSSLDAATSRLNNEDAQWAQADTELTSLRTAAQALNTQIKDTSVTSMLASANEKLAEAGTTAQTVAASAANQNAVLDQRQAELGLVQSQVTQAQDLQQNVTQRLTTFQATFEVFQADVTNANSLNQASVDKTRAISDKIELLESKLMNAEKLLAKIRKPVNFDGTFGLELTNPEVDVAHLYDDIQLEMRKPVNFTDGVVFFTDNPSTNAELEIGVLNDQIFFEYSAGTQVFRVTSPAEICDNCWARVHASRYADTGHLSVILMSSGGVASNSIRGSGNSDARLVTLTSDLFIGNLPDTKQTTKVVNRVFTGCLHNVKYQGQMLSLWTTSPTSNQAAQCCQSPPDLAVAPSIMGASFSGFGYLVLSPGTLVFSQTRRMTLEFRTFSDDVMLLTVISADEQTRNIVYLSNGVVGWQINSGGQLYTLESQGQFATGQWVQVLMEGEGTEFKLTVRLVDDTDDPTTITRTVSALDLTPLDGQNLILGSATDPSATGYSVTDTNFAGCMRNIEITTVAATTQLSFTDNVATQSGVSTDGCFENIIDGLRFTAESSYAQLSAIEQTQQLRTLELDFVTEQAHGILLYLNAPGALRFLYVAVFGGNVIVVYRQENAAAVVSSGQYVSDGQLHTIKIDCITLRVSLKVDGIAFEESAQTLNTDYLTFSQTAVLRLGGVEEGVSLQTECPVAHSLIGGISRLMVNDRVMSFTQSTIASQQDVSLAGIPAPSATTPAPPVSTVPPLQECAQPSVPAVLLPEAGFTLDGTTSINWSELMPNIQLSEYFERNFALNIDFAAYKADGVLFYVADLLNNPSYYFTLYLLDGYIHLRMRTNRNIEYDVQLSKQYNDGQRYQLRMVKINDFASIDIDPEKDYINTEADSAVASQLAIPPTTSVYLGGIGLNNLVGSALPTTFKEQNSKVNFAGAIYSIDLRSDEQAQANVSFPVDQLDRSAYPVVPADVYYGASLSGNNSYIGLGAVTTPQNLYVELTFTTTSESGLFFLIDRATSSKFMAMDMNKQQLRLHLYPSFNGVTEALMLILYESANLCDGVPHTVELRVQSNSATATIDDKVGPSVFIPQSHAVQTFIDAELYIGGYSGQNGALPSSLITASLTGCVMSVKLATGILGDATTSFDPTQFKSTSVGLAFSCPL